MLTRRKRVRFNQKLFRFKIVRLFFHKTFVATSLRFALLITRFILQKKYDSYLFDVIIVMHKPLRDPLFIKKFQGSGKKLAMKIRFFH